MKHKKVFSALFAVSAMALAGSAKADLYPDFQVNPTALGGAAVFTADKITGNYVEVVSFNTDSTFDISLIWQAGEFVANDGSQVVAHTGVTISYGLYASFQGSGTFTGTGETAAFTLTPGGSLALYADSPMNDGFFTPPTSGTGAFTASGTADDTLFGTGAGTMGSGSLSCSAGNNCGSFGQVTSFNLTAAGSAFFIGPNPFYNVSLQSGQFNGFSATPGTTQTLNGSMDVIFQPVPEPSSIAMLSLGLLGVGVATRRRTIRR